MTSHGWAFGNATSKEQQLKIVEAVQKLQGVTTVHLITGPYDIMVEFNFEGRSYADFRTFLNDLLAQGIHNIEVWFGL